MIQRLVDFDAFISMHSPSTVNAMSDDEFIRTFAEVYESSAWIVIKAAPMRPFADGSALLQTLRQIVDGASTAEQDALIRAHPDLAGRLAREGQLTESSTREQARLGLDRLSAEEYAAFDRLNRAYKDKFHFPFIICVGLLSHRSEILDAFEKRIHNSIEAERGEALEQIHQIARVRMKALIPGIE